MYQVVLTEARRVWTPEDERGPRVRHSLTPIVNVPYSTYDRQGVVVAIRESELFREVRAGTGQVA